MQLSNLLTLLAAVATGANANVAAPRALHLADFRIYSGSGCDTGNLGIVSVYEGDVRPGGCKQLVDTNVKSVSTVDINTNCKLYFFTDLECRAGKEEVSWKQCYGSLDGIKSWNIKCD
ncbi:hypothetical protein JDV02_003418 [Purpureocillium takamizusanense]|uniref:Uncharacterized protein n=1 Tax=Purpureocillium takamizusanense TaxID=2060973 RepID=A0A9Q8QDM7_9HYPO|nr:uncharacterized protein JDV02_003418 [Purpureocillium takamizusanense]UNI17039.1 hypothetical protein JDV02_003418 [Purpureocillium takamizusanense]